MIHDHDSVGGFTGFISVAPLQSESMALLGLQSNYMLLTINCLANKM